MMLGLYPCLPSPKHEHRLDSSPRSLLYIPVTHAWLPSRMVQWPGNYFSLSLSAYLCHFGSPGNKLSIVYETSRP